ncbi:mono-functional DNA-alkylating methyl methanesulfonate N-term-domain-containing protein [Lineolata rhizophorae]|uniref:Mono-functional DNA-alkylating methyl methanesulfonate N-term-domain-containing protein n=1 Tax=Lineolata rhizophorae TaxID=578093 RepID=A0A6A6P526_9PEZI|nr:mono-functional DNA-alkylating methyl methanesulfonate N-term-domain-containing protein [Lineolata rhizophorae]
MAYITPIHRPSSIRHALALNLLAPDEPSLVVAKSNRLEILSFNPKDGLLKLVHSSPIYGQVAMLDRIRPASSQTDHLFVGTDRFHYFTVSWDAGMRRLRTEKSFVDIADKTARDSQTGDRCQIDPSGRFMTLELYEGVVTVVPFVSKGKRRNEPSSGELGDPIAVRIPEFFVRSSAFMHKHPAASGADGAMQGSSKGAPRLALLYEDTHKKVRVKIRHLLYTPGTGADNEVAELSNAYDIKDDLELGSSHLIPIPRPIYGLLILGETSISYYHDDTQEIKSRPLQEATMFVCWEAIDAYRYVLADDYGQLYLIMLEVGDNERVSGWRMDKLGETSRASTLVYLGAGFVFIGSHQGDSRLVRIVPGAIEVLQTFHNIAPILDLSIMDMGNRSKEQMSEFSSGQARLVTGSGSYKDGSLRSVRSGVGMEDLGVLGNLEAVIELFGLKSNPASGLFDTLVATFVTETRFFCFDEQGTVEEVSEFKGFSMTENSLLVQNISGGRILQVTRSGVRVSDLESGVLESEWTPPNGKNITNVGASDTIVVLAVGDVHLVVLDVANDLRIISEKEISSGDQVSCIEVSTIAPDVCFVGFWQTTSIVMMELDTLEDIRTESIADDNGVSVPRSILVANIHAYEPPVLLVSRADGYINTFAMDPNTHSLTDKKSIILGSQQIKLKLLPQPNGLSNVFAICEHPSLIYGSEGHLMCSAITAEDATSVCLFNQAAFPNAVAIATEEGEVKLSLIDAERTTHVQTLPVHETVRRIAYSPALRAFGLGTIKRTLTAGEEVVESRFKLVDELMFKELDTFELEREELVECVIRAELTDGRGDVAERFVVGTSSLVDTDDTAAVGETVTPQGRMIVLEVTQDRKVKMVAELKLKGACRCLGIVDDDKIVAGLVKTVAVYAFHHDVGSKAYLSKRASYRAATAPIDLSICGNDTIAVGDLMKSLTILKYTSRGNRKGATGEDVEGNEEKKPAQSRPPPRSSLPDSLVEVARHYATSWVTAVAEVSKDTFVQADAEGNLLVLERETSGVTEDDNRRLKVMADFRLGELTNRIRAFATAPMPTTLPQTAAQDAMKLAAAAPPVVPRAFVATVEGSIYLFGLIAPHAQNLLIELQRGMAGAAAAGLGAGSLGEVPFDAYRAFRSQTVTGRDEPMRFVDGELVERFVDAAPEVQREIVKGMAGVVGFPARDSEGLEEGVAVVKVVVERLRLLH